MTRAPLTTVPFRLLKSRIRKRPASQRIEQWRRDMAGSGVQRSLVDSRPIDASAEVNDRVLSLRGPETPTSLGCVSEGEPMTCPVWRFFNTLRNSMHVSFPEVPGQPLTRRRIH